jgi:small ligand-binding sensory domain FIST
MNRFAAALSTDRNLDDAIAQASAEIKAVLGKARPSLAVVFASHDHESGFGDLARRVRAATGADRLLGCAGDTVVGGGREIEEGPSLSIWVANFPEGEVETFRLEVETEDEAIHIRGFPGMPDAEQPGGRSEDVSMLLLADPYSFPADLFLQQLNDAKPGLKVIGGMASGGAAPGENALFVDDECVHDGAVGAVLHGIPMRHVVSQGCRPIGRSMVITRAHENVIDELAGKPPLEQLKRVFEESNDDEKSLLQRATRGGGLHIGQVVDERQSNPGRGDFLVRNVMAADQKSGSMHIGDQARRGRTVRFHVRDARSADEDLRDLLTSAKNPAAPAGALLFTCNGRGKRFFEVADHDAGSVQTQLGPVPAAGFFAAGEIGPIGGRNYLHGFTASVALFDA